MLDKSVGTSLEVISEEFLRLSQCPTAKEDLQQNEVTTYPVYPHGPADRLSSEGNTAVNSPDVIRNLSRDKVELKKRKK
jgi:hypothetical protein